MNITGVAVGPQFQNGNNNRRKRSTHSSDPNSYTDDNVQLIVEESGEDHEPSQESDTWPTPSGITEAVARTTCENAIQSSNIYTTCTQKLDAGVLQDHIDACVIDIQVMEIILFRRVQNSMV